ncbi:MAG: hypothetical protein ACE5OZ_02635 [Candidatus Heimdallarchaeota archaeon]
MEGIEVYYAYAVRYRGNRTIPPEFIERGVQFLDELTKTEAMAIMGGTDSIEMWAA